MSETLRMATALVVLTPLLAGLLVCANRRISRVVVLAGCGLSCLFSCVLLAELSSHTVQFPQHWILFSWLGSSELFPLSVDVGFRIDGLSALLLTTVTLTATLVAADAARNMQPDSERRRFLFSVSLVLFSTNMLLLSPNFIQLFFFWKLATVGVYLYEGPSSKSASTAIASRRVFLVNWATDVLFLFGLLLVGIGFGSFDFDDVLFDHGMIAEVVESNSSLVAAICICLFVGSIGRCAQFPLFGWLEQAATSSGRINALTQGSCLLPAGVYLIARCAPLYEVSAEARLFTGIVGGLTAIMTSAAAVGCSNWKQLLSYNSASLMGLMFLGLATGTWAGVAAAIFLLVIHSLVKTPLFLGVDTVARQTDGQPAFGPTYRSGHELTWALRMFLVGAVVLVSGFWGQSTIESSVWESASQLAGDTSPQQNAASAPLMGLEAQTWFLILSWAATLSLMLSAFAFVRALMLTFSQASHNAEHLTTPSTDGWPPGAMLAIGLAAIGGPLLAGPTRLFQQWLGRTWNTSDITVHSDAFAPGFGILLVLLSIIAGWLLFRKSSQLSRYPEQASQPWSRGLAPLRQLSRNNFYLDDILFLTIVLPVRGVAQLCRFLDWFLVDGLLMGVPSQITSEIANAAKPLRNGFVQFYATSVVIAVAVLAVLLTWMGNTG